MFGFITPALFGATGPTGPTYSEWVAYETARATGGVVNWATNNGFGGTAPFRTTAGPVGGSMEGSVWLKGFGGAASPCRIIQHGLPSQSIFDEQIAAGRMIVFSLISGPEGLQSGISRNGYTSGTYDGESAGGTQRCRSIRFYRNGPFEMDPYAGTGPTPYDLV